jgi:predicted nucleic acid-binding protein
MQVLVQSEASAMASDATACQAVVLDTNILVGAGFNPRSNSARLVDAVRERRLRMIWNAATRSEAEYILRKIPRLSWDRFASLFRETDRYPGETAPERFDAVADPADRKFAALADAANVVLVTQDAGLIQGLAQTSVAVATPGEFVRRCGV